MNETLILLSYCIFNRLHNWTFFAKVIIIFQNDSMYAVPGSLLELEQRLTQPFAALIEWLAKLLEALGAFRTSSPSLKSLTVVPGNFRFSLSLFQLVIDRKLNLN